MTLTHLLALLVAGADRALVLRARLGRCRGSVVAAGLGRRRGRVVRALLDRRGVAGALLRRDARIAALLVHLVIAAEDLRALVVGAGLAGVLVATLVDVVVNVVARVVVAIRGRLRHRCGAERG